MSDRVAVEDIPFGDPGRGVFAFRKGDRVPSELVTQNGWEDYVSTPGAKSAKQAVAEASGTTKES